MCTVTYIPSGNHFFFTSSRDEQLDRPAAIFPQLYEIEGQRMLFPKDPQGGGSWIAMHESGNIGVLLNGAIKAHQPHPPYRKSRGLVLLDLITKTSPIDAFEEMDFNGIEPFTVILFDGLHLYSAKWDGRMKWQEAPDPRRPHIWSSVTLYDPVSIRKREGWFNQWLSENPYPGTLDIMHFHQKGGDGDPFNNILMKRHGNLFTNSISSIRRAADAANFRYLDLRTGETAEYLLPLQKSISVKV
jgi:hypothetical protein